jgi:hypothetical protein
VTSKRGPRARAKQNSVKFGRRRVLDGFQRQEALRRREALSLIAQSYRLSAKTISRL